MGILSIIASHYWFLFFPPHLMADFLLWAIKGKALARAPFHFKGENQGCKVSQGMGERE